MEFEFYLADNMNDILEIVTANNYESAIKIFAQDRGYTVIDYEKENNRNLAHVVYSNGDSNIEIDIEWL